MCEDMVKDCGNNPRPEYSLKSSIHNTVLSISQAGLGLAMNNVFATLRAKETCSSRCWTNFFSRLSFLYGATTSSEAGPPQSRGF
jgi:hypothetical protein